MLQYSILISLIALSTASNFQLSFNDSTLLNASFVVDNFVYSRNKWATEEYLSYALWGAGTYSSLSWGSGPSYIGSYSCQGPYIAEKLLSLGSDTERKIVTNWLRTLPISQVGKVWEAQNTEWHVQVQGTWESSAEFLILVRHLAAYANDAQSTLTISSERLLCQSVDNGITFTLLNDGVIQPNVTDDICLQTPESLLLQYTNFFVDFPSLPFSGPSEQLENSGRILTQGFIIKEAGITHLSLPILTKNAKEIWLANITLYDTSTGEIVGSAYIPRNSDFSTFQIVKLTKQISIGSILVAILSLDENGAPTGQTVKDSWFTSLGWLTNGAPAISGGASSSTYGISPHWIRNESSNPFDPRLIKKYTLTRDEAVSLELSRVLSRSNRNESLGMSIADYTSLALSWVLALSSQTPTITSGGYDIFVIPDPNFRGSFEEDVDSGCSYYDLLRIGFASSYINLRALEGLLAYAELQEAGIITSTCSSSVSSFGIDNANVLVDFNIPCYTSNDISDIIKTMRFAIGNRFSNNVTGHWIDWYGCSILGINNNVTQCGLSNVQNGLSDNAPNLIAIRTDFVPTIALAAKLGVKAGGSNISATLYELSRAIAFEDNITSGVYHGPGWFPNALLPLELSNGGAYTTIASLRWDLKDDEGFAIRSENETGDWHMFPYSSIQGGLSMGYGSYGGQAENGGRFFTTTAMIFEAISSPLSNWFPPGPYKEIVRDFKRIVISLDSIGHQLESGNTETPLLSNDRLFLATKVNDTLIFDLCTKVRKEFNFPNKTDTWGERLCDYYQDVCWATPESGAVIFSFLKGLLGAHITASGKVYLLGVLSPIWYPSSSPWIVSIEKTSTWIEEITSLLVQNVQIRGISVLISCDSIGLNITCTVSVE